MAGLYQCDCSGRCWLPLCHFCPDPAGTFGTSTQLIFPRLPADVQETWPREHYLVLKFKLAGLPHFIHLAGTPCTLYRSIRFVLRHCHLSLPYLWHDLRPIHLVHCFSLQAAR